MCHARMISAFLYEHYWTREPSVVGLWMPIHSPYIKILTEKYSYSGQYRGCLLNNVLAPVRLRIVLLELEEFCHQVDIWLHQGLSSQAEHMKRYK